ncbi:MAG: type II toxin-antitoxin system RelE/ParE family toxin [Acidiferrobacteraceae bacterium]
MQPVIFHPDAYQELAQARNWYEERVAGLGDMFFSEVESAILAIKNAPDTWPNYTTGTRRFLVHRFPFAVIYRHDDRMIQVIAIMHLKRRPGYWRSRNS